MREDSVVAGEGHSRGVFVVIKIKEARGYNVIQYKESVIPDQNYVRSYAGIRSHNYYKSDLEDLSVLVHIL